MKRFAHCATTLFFAMASAAVVAYSLAHVAHYSLGVPAPTLREQALVSAALICGLVMIEFLVSKRSDQE